MPFLDQIGSLFNAVKEHESEPPLWIEIPQERVIPHGNTGSELVPHETYFEIRVHQIYLPYERQWYKTFEPTALAVADFGYGSGQANIPLVVGPSLMNRGKKETPLGMVYSDTLVAGPSPYKGDGMTLAVILYAAQRDDHLRRLLDVLGKTAGALDVTASIQIYTKIAGVVADGLDGLTSSLRPVLGYRKQFRPVRSGYFALVNQTERKYDPDHLWVVKEELHYGPSQSSAKPFGGAEYVLYGIKAVSRENFENLPVFAKYREVLELANRSKTEEIWEDTKLKLSDLVWAIQDSADLTEPDKERLLEEWQATVVAIHKKAVGRAKLGVAEDAGSVRAASLTEDRNRARRLAVLKL